MHRLTGQRRRGYIGGKKPKILTPLKDTKVTAQSTATLTCDLDLGEPKADIRWYKESRELYEGKKHSMSCDGKRAKLEINQADLSDSAIYRVEADNRHGRVMSEAKVFVQGKISGDATRWTRVDIFTHGF